jgi:hypothetical protein
MAFIIRAFIVLCITLTLAACGSKQSQYTYLFKNPTVLKQQWQECQAKGVKAKAISKCRDAWVVAKVLHDYLSLQESHAVQISEDRQKLIAMQQAGASKAMRQPILNNFSKLMMNVQANFTQQIMATETKLSQLKEALHTMRQNIRIGTLSAKQHKALTLKIQHTKQAITLQQDLIGAMYALLNLTMSG